MDDSDNPATDAQDPGGHRFWGNVRAAIVVGQCALAAMGVLWFRRGTWKHRKI